MVEALEVGHRESQPGFVRVGLALAAVGCALLPRLVLSSTLQDRSAFTLFTLAVMVSARFGGALSGIIATVLSTLAAVVLILGPAATNSEQVADLTEIGLFCLVASGITWLAVQLHGARLRAEDALAHVKTLRGLLPICAGCKKIRDANGEWEQMEIYVSRHSNAEFSHGFCDECFRRLYPGIDPGPPSSPPS